MFYLTCSIPMRVAARSEDILPIMQQRLREESKLVGRHGRKYTSCSKRCCDSAGRRTRVPSSGSKKRYIKIESNTILHEKIFPRCCVRH